MNMNRCKPGDKLIMRDLGETCTYVRRLDFNEHEVKAKNGVKFKCHDNGQLFYGQESTIDVVKRLTKSIYNQPTTYQYIWVIDYYNPHENKWYYYNMYTTRDAAYGRVQCEKLYDNTVKYRVRKFAPQK